jgi:hypothetical protein
MHLFRVQAAFAESEMGLDVELSLILSQAFPQGFQHRDASAGSEGLTTG